VSAHWERLAALALEVEAAELERLAHAFGDFERVCTHWHLHGGGHTGIGEDVCYAPEEHDALQAAGPPASLAGSWTLGAFCEHVESLDLFPEPPEQEGSRHYRVWAVESAALDLALRQAGTSLHACLGLEPRPLTFVCSMRLGDPPTLDGLRRRLEIAPGLRFKLDAQSTWTDEIFTELQRLGCVESFDLKGMYSGTIVDQAADPELYRRCAEDFPEALLEDPRLTEETDPILAPHRDRITWDAPIHGIADIEALPFPPRTVNVKPSRIGPLRELLATYAYCEERGIRMYSGGQTELGVGRGHIQLLASLFHPDTGNDVAPGGFNLPDPPADLPSPPLDPSPDRLGFRRVG
jgi:L-alanine-DL-glutamate epimerase-like enolase superfamily enzyme